MDDCMLPSTHHIGRANNNNCLQQIRIYNHIVYVFIALQLERQYKQAIDATVSFNLHFRVICVCPYKNAFFIERRWLIRVTLHHMPCCTFNALVRVVERERAHVDQSSFTPIRVNRKKARARKLVKESRKHCTIRSDISFVSFLTNRPSILNRCQQEGWIHVGGKKSLFNRYHVVAIVIAISNAQWRLHGVWNNYEAIN